MNDQVLCDTENHVCTITLNRPEIMNAIGMDILRGIDAAIADVENNAGVKAVVIRGEGEKAFSAGGNLKEFRSLGDDTLREWIKYGNQVFNRLESLEKPTLAVIQGYALGGGLELALACDFRIASTDAVFASRELAHGWIPGWGGMTRLRRLIGEPRAKEVVFLGQDITGEGAARMGLVAKAVPPAELEKAAADIIETLASIDPSAFRMAKAALQDENRGTGAADVLFDLHATQVSRSSGIMNDNNQ